MHRIRKLLLVFLAIGVLASCQPSPQEQALIARRVTEDFNTADSVPRSASVTVTVTDKETGKVTTETRAVGSKTTGITTAFPRRESGWPALAGPSPWGAQEVKVCWTARQYLAGWVHWYTFCNAVYYKWGYGRVILQEPGVPNSFYGPMGVGFFGLLNAEDKGGNWYRAPYWYQYFYDGYWPYSGLHQLADGHFRVCPMFTVFGIGCTPTFTIRMGIRAHSDGTAYYTIDSDW